MKIYVLNTLEIGLSPINILSQHIPIEGVIGLSQRKRSDSISGFLYMSPFCQQNDLLFHEVKSYSLKSSNDKKMLSSLEIDILLVIGWQRLVPEWLIDHCKICVIGAHGSSGEINKWRGRSPMNWAIILDKQTFNVNIFSIDRGVDSGEVIAVKEFEINKIDNVRSAYYKYGLIMADLIIENLNNGKIISKIFREQRGEIRYFPKRIPEDGEIDWSRSASQIFNFTRSLTKPYPGAFTTFADTKIKIWGGVPIYDIGQTSKHPGEVVHTETNGDFVVVTGRGLFMVHDYEIESHNSGFNLKPGQILDTCSFNKQMEKIIARHEAKYPNHVLSDEIYGLVNN